jgi:ChrR Cupin-like domain
MDEVMLHADRTLPALVRGDSVPWLRSPLPGVERRLLERAGGEVALASSIVRYAPGSRFAAHGHDLGEEFLVLEGVFSDENGDYPAGTYVRNPPGSRHSPFSERGCVIFVKLRQMGSRESQALRVRAEDRVWATTHQLGHERTLLFSSDAEAVELESLAPGIQRHPPASLRGEELFVVQGSLDLLEPQRTTLRAWGWSRLPARGHVVGRAGPDGALLWVKYGHL